MLASTTMNMFKVHGCYRLQSLHSQNTLHTSLTTYHKSKLCRISPTSILSSYHQSPTFRTNLKRRKVRVSAPLCTQQNDEEEYEYARSSEDLTMNGDVYQKTLRLVECSMFAALGGLTYILSSSLAIEVFF